MKYTFKYDVGFMGSSGPKFHATGDTEDLSSPLKKTMESLIDYHPPAAPKTNPAAKDMTEYEFNLDDGNKSKVLKFKEDAIPDELRALVTHLKAKATDFHT